MLDPAAINLIITFCAALAAAGAFYVHARRLKLEKAVMVVTSVTEETAGDALVGLLNVGGRPAMDVSVTTDPLKPGAFMEGIAAGEAAEVRVDLKGLPATLLISWTDLHAGRTTEKRVLAMLGDHLGVGRREAMERLPLQDFNVLETATKPADPES